MTFLRVSSESRGLLPNADTLVVSVSLVCDVKLGFSMRAFTNTPRVSRTRLGLTFTFFFVSRYSTTLFTTCEATASTCVPPLLVQMPFTNDDAKNPSPGVAVTAIVQRSFGLSVTTVSAPYAFA